MINASIPPLNSHGLTPLVISLSQHFDYLYPFLQDQIPSLDRLGYKAFVLEYDQNLFIDEDEFTKRFFADHCPEIDFIKDSEISANPEIIAQVLSTQANTYNGGVILILTSSKIHASSVLAKLSKEHAMQCQFFADTISSDPESNVIVLSPDPSCLRAFWRPIENFLKRDQTTTPYTTLTNSSFEARLKRILEVFNIVKDQSGKEHGVLPFNNMDQFHYLSKTIEKKMAITPILQWTTVDKNPTRQFSLIIPNLDFAKKPPISSFKKKSETTNDQFRENINYWLENSSTKTNLNFQGNVLRWILKLPFGEEISLKKKGVVVKIELIEINKLSNDFFEPLEAILVLYLRSRETLLCSLSIDKESNTFSQLANKEALKNMRKMLIERGSKRDKAFLCQNHHEPLNWESYSYTYFYDNEIENYYLAAHAFIGKYLLNKVPRLQKITLFSFGCGDGKELITIKDQLQKNGRIVSKLVGFDINSNNFDSNKMSEIEYVQGDLSCLEILLDSTTYDKNTFKIGLFLGLLEHGCLEGTYHALSILQQARIMDTIIICSFTDVLLNKEMLKAAGYHVREQSETRASPENFFHLTPMAPNQRKFFLLKRVKNRTYQEIFDCLDLSLSAHPYKDLTLFSHAALEYINQVNISWSYFQIEEIKPFFEKLATLNRPLDILISKNQLSFEMIQNEVGHHPNMTLIARLDVANQYECPLFSPKKAKSLNVYKQCKI